MCGLFAGSGNIKTPELVSLGVSNMERGVDSSGVAYLDNEGYLMIEKIAQHPAVAFPITLTPAISRALDMGIIIGHTRQATTGDVNNTNAHPFLTDGIAFAHNGMIFNYKEFGEFNVDSECLIQGIKARNFSAFDGPIALVWVQDKLLHAYVNGNPLFRGRLDGAVYLASEKEFLERIGCEHIKALAEDRIYIFEGDKIKEMIEVDGPKAWPTFSQANTGMMYVKDSDEKQPTWLEDYTHNRQTLREMCTNCGIEEAMNVTDFCFSCGQKYGLFESNQTGD